MRRTLLAVTLVLVAGLLFATGVQEEGTGAVKNPDTLIYATYGTIESLDPAKAYDTASWTNMTNIYEQLVAFDG